VWYVVQVRVGTEEKTKLQCEKKVSPEVMERCFIPYYELKRRTQGKWEKERKILFPGYLFVVTEDIDGLFHELKLVSGLTKLIGVGDDIVPLEESEVKLLKRFGGEAQVVHMSEGIIENSEVKILSGPLEGMEGWVKKIDRHKRKAWLELELFGGIQRVEVGLEIIAKTG
jgi:transcriptional antiterminator NusG